MAKITSIQDRRPLSGRRAVTLDLPEFLIQALELRVDDANRNATCEDRVTVEHLVELELAETISIGEVALLEARLPGISQAVSQWLHDID